MNATERLTQARTELVLGHPFFGALALRLNVVADPAAKTAWTDGRSLAYDPKYVGELTLAETTGLVAHEVMHCALGHPWRRAGRDAKLWNQACDLALNPIVRDAGLTLPEGALFPPKAWEGKPAEWIYARLQEEQSGGGGTGPDGDGQGDEGSGSDDTPGCGEVRDGSQAEAAEQQAEWEVATLQAAQAAATQGKLPGGIREVANEIRRPKVDWRSALRRFVQETAKADYSWRMPNPRYAASGLYLPALRSESLPPIVVAVDTSGSVDAVLLNEFAGEVQAILDEALPSALHVVCCDAAVQDVQDFAPGDQVVIRPVGGGGTDFRPVFDWIEENAAQPACLIYLTDLYGTFPKQAPDYPVLWAATTRQRAPWGDTLELEASR